ncbi:transporter [Paenibacillus sp. Soil787]|nr:transporter [Paenibacillus sp. Soil787]
MQQSEVSGSTRQPLPPPPAYIPPKPYGTYMIDCVHQYTYVWLLNGDSFWFFPIRVESFGTSGFRWTGSFWMFFGIDSRSIDTVACPPIPTLY